MLKVLVATTCVVVIAAIGYWSWTVYQDRQQAQKATTFAAEEIACGRLIDDIRNGRVEQHVVGEIAVCVARDHFAKADLVAAGRPDLAEKMTDSMLKGFQH